MTEEEKKITKRLKDDIALVTFNDNLNYGIGNLYVNINDLKIILNLISKLQADIEIKDKVIENLDEKFRYAVPDDAINELYVSKDKIKFKIKYNKVFNDDIHKYAVITLEDLLKE